MLAKISERQMHVFRYVLVIGWLILILSLFYDPISQYLTDPNNIWSPFRDKVSTDCIRVQGECLANRSYPIAARLFWGMIVPSGIGIVFILGHETWRRICPLYFLSQIPRRLGFEKKLDITKNEWFQKNHLYLQFVLLFVGISCRILFVNSTRIVLGVFLIITIASAIGFVYIYGGRSWCHYVCPFGIVQTVFTGPRGLLTSEAHKASPRSVTQSMCRSFDSEKKKEIITCISCNSPCMDIDAEKAYWEQLDKPGRKLVQYGYLGLVIGYFVYYFLYSGNWDYYFSGLLKEDQLSIFLKPGFYLFDRAIPVPRLLAVPLTLGIFVIVTFWLGKKAEKLYRAFLKNKQSNISRQKVTHRVFSIYTFLAFNIFYIYGGRPEIMRLPVILQLLFNGLVVLVSTFWLYRTWGRTQEQYKKESIADKLRRQLGKLSIDFTGILKNRSLAELKPDELDILAKVIPQVSSQEKRQVYKGVLEESLIAGNIEAIDSLGKLESTRQQLGISAEEHQVIINELGIEKPTLLKVDRKITQEEWLRVESYRDGISSLLQELIDRGMPFDRAIREKTKQIKNLRKKYSITKQEHFQVLEGLFDSLRPKAEKLLALLEVEASRYKILKNLKYSGDDSVFILLRKFILTKQQLIATPLLAVLEMLDREGDNGVIQLARRTGILADEAISIIMREPDSDWKTRLSPAIIQELYPKREEDNNNNKQIAIDSTKIKTGQMTELKLSDITSEVAEQTAIELLQEPNPLIQASSLYALNKLNSQLAKTEANRLLSYSLVHDLVKETAMNILSPKDLGIPSSLEKLLSKFQEEKYRSLNIEQLMSVADLILEEERGKTIIYQSPLT